MVDLKNARIVRLLGVCSTERPSMLIEEFLVNGNLHTFLVKVCASFTYLVPDNLQGRPTATTMLIQPRKLVQFILDISDGLAYLAEHRIVHRVSGFLRLYLHITFKSW